MTLTMPFPTASRLVPAAPLLFARHTEREHEDVDDDEPDDFDDLRPRRPRYRAFMKIALILLLVVGAWYVSTDPDLRSSVSRRVMAVIDFAERSFRSGAGTTTLLSQTVPVPVFHEGQQVVVTVNAPPQARFLQLHQDATETQPGPLVKIGDGLTVIDGRLVRHQWVYLVRMDAGDSGWIPEEHLRARP